MKKTTRACFEFFMKMNVCDVSDKLLTKVRNFTCIKTNDQDAKTI